MEIEFLSAKLGRAIQCDTFEWLMEQPELAWEPYTEAWIHPKTGKPSKNSFGVFRSDDQSEIHTVTGRYVASSHAEEIKLFSQVCEIDLKNARYTNVVSCDNGGKLSVAARVPHLDFAVLGADPHRIWALLNIYHDGSGKTKMKLFGERQWCTNGAVVTVDGPEGFVLGKKTKSYAARLRDYRKALASSAFVTRSFQERLDFLASKQMNSKNFDEFMKFLEPGAFDLETGKRKLQPSTGKESVNTTIDYLTGVFETPEIHSQAGTFFQAWSALTSEASHMRQSGKNADSPKYDDASRLHGRSAKKLRDGMNWLLATAGGFDASSILPPIAEPEPLVATSEFGDEVWDMEPLVKV